MIHPYFISGFGTGIVVGIIVIALFFYRWKKREKRLKERHDNFIHVVENTKDFIYYYQLYPKRGYQYLSPSAEHFFGEGSIERAFKDPDVPFKEAHPDDYEILIKKINGELDFNKGIVQRWLDKNGEYRWFEEYATPIYQNGKLVALQGVLRNIDEKVKLQQELEYQLHHDSLTGIYNRTYFESCYSKYNEKTDTSIAFILCDLDDLKNINDSFGHKYGDELLKEAAGLLNQFSEDGITVARLGGDEFVLLIPGITEEELAQFVSNLVRRIDDHNENEDAITIKLSIGCAFSATSLGLMPDLFSQADRNMYRDKNKRKQAGLV
ncbi:diguanylate cyclase domain-containing protein [Heyndrickxia sp. MSNUG]|uniref:sensor domain-containing diguanylate cyclase n=1 Tax=Heyndrickxia sp. MSNUG TaxID=3136677 RepID=UPI003C2B379A